MLLLLLFRILKVVFKLGKGFRFASSIDYEIIKLNEKKRKHRENYRNYMNRIYQCIADDVSYLEGSKNVKNDD